MTNDKIDLPFNPEKIVAEARGFCEKNDVDKAIALYTSALSDQDSSMLSLLSQGDAYGVQDQKGLMSLFEHFGFCWLAKEYFDRAEECFSFASFLNGTQDEINDSKDIFRAIITSTEVNLDNSYAKSIIDYYGNFFTYEFDFSYYTEDILRCFIHRKHDLFCIGLYNNFSHINRIGGSFVSPLVLIKYVKQRYKIPILVVNYFTWLDWEQPLLDARVDFIFEGPFQFDQLFLKKVTHCLHELNPKKFTQEITDNSGTHLSLLRKSGINYTPREKNRQKKVEASQKVQSEILERDAKKKQDEKDRKALEYKGQQNILWQKSYRLYAKGKEQYEDGNYHEAIKLFTANLALFPDSPTTLLHRAWAWSKLGETEKAYNDTRKALGHYRFQGLNPLDCR